jgi:hypothetical protein
LRRFKAASELPRRTEQHRAGSLGRRPASNFAKFTASASIRNQANISFGMIHQNHIHHLYAAAKAEKVTSVVSGF